MQTYILFEKVRETWVHLGEYNDPTTLARMAYHLGALHGNKPVEIRVETAKDEWHDATVSEKKGIYPKYIVTKSKTGEPVDNCFILRPDRDPAARTALYAYAKATNNKALADDICAWINHLEVPDDA